MPGHTIEVAVDAVGVKSLKVVKSVPRNAVVARVFLTTASYVVVTAL
jgi:hypothetical protein